jgi:cardiolipin synthase A/B
MTNALKPGVIRNQTIRFGDGPRVDVRTKTKIESTPTTTTDTQTQGQHRSLEVQLPPNVANRFRLGNQREGVPRAGTATVGNALDIRFGKVVAPAVGSSAFESALDAITGTTRRGGNDVKLLLDGQASFPERLKLIRDAKSSVHLQTFIFASDATGWEMANALAEKARAGIPVRVIVDAIGSHIMTNDMKQMMRDAGVDLRVQGTLLSPNQLWHEKHLIVDGEVAINGGMNIADKYALGGSGKMVLSKDTQTSSSPWRDVDVRVEGASVHDVQRAFLRNWASVGGSTDIPQWNPSGHRPANGADEHIRVVQHRPIEAGDDNTHLVYMAAVKGAQTSIDIENAYFVPTPELRDALIEAARRGVKVRIMTNSDTSNDMGIVTGCARAFYADLLRAGVEIYERNGDSTLHSKTATFDGQFSLVGSCNLNGRSRHYDSEVLICSSSERIAAELHKRFEDGIPEATRITPDSAVLKGWRNQLRSWLLSTFADVF